MINIVDFIPYLLLICVIIVYRTRRKSPRTKLPPVCPGALPIIGHMDYFVSDGTELWERMKKVQEFTLSNGGVSVMRLACHTAYTITDPDNWSIVVSSCIEKPAFFDFAKKIFDNGLVTAKGMTWKTHRKLLNPAFMQININKYIDTFNSEAKVLVKNLEAHVGSTFIATEQLLELLSRIVCGTTLGLKGEDHSEIIKKYAQEMDKVLHLFVQRFQKPWLYIPYFYNRSQIKIAEDRINDVTTNILNKVIQKKRQELMDTPTYDEEKSKTFLDLVLKQNSLTDKEIQEHAHTIIGASFDTSVTTLTHIMLLLGTYTDVQDKVFKELQDVLGTEDTDINKHDLSKLVYLDAVLKETLRYYPIVPIIARCAQTDVQIKNHIIPKGSICVLSVYGLHRHPMWGSDANRFRPERWLEPGGVPDGVSPFVAFGLGKRNCIGKTYAMTVIKVIMAHVVRKYHISADFGKLVSKYELVLKPAKGHEICLQLRK